jgi:hypothetical protein
VDDGADVPLEILERLRPLCLALPEVVEKQARVGTRWCVRRKNFAHVVVIADGWPPAYAAAAGLADAVVLTFRSAAQEVRAFAGAGPPFFVPPWFPNIVGLVLDADTDWDEVAELVTESYCTLAPKRLAALVERPAP